MSALLSIAAAATLAAGVPQGPGAEPAPAPRPGWVQVPAFPQPPSQYLSPEAAKALAGQLARAHYSDPMTWAAHADAVRGLYDGIVQPLVAKWRARYAVEVQDTRIAGVRVDVITPQGGVRPDRRNKVLINLHGGAFIVGGRWGGQLEGTPVAAIGGYKVVAVDYRMAPEHRFPAASEDVAAVYRVLLKTYRPENIGIYGCSSGGTLTAQSVVWFSTHGLPRPGAVGILCASLDPNFGGDSVYTTAPLTGLPAVAPPVEGRRWPGTGSVPYMAQADLSDAQASPLQHPDVLSHFPPTLVMTSTRAPELSAAVFSHGQLKKVGVDAELDVWDGLWHGFAGDPDLPESIDFQRRIVDFFDRHFGVANRAR